ncbi:unnamed protein product [Rangifer tarandus platyrhynchus]|uniref:Uncharacterized protein n=2 Tax=Rangifer tarandus platyrhynchus TaxID=3082113 RepID=A0ACB0DYW5_RANTA|nr:unnamed protein product [Rangifer tarandus platyrhynchus]CAI9693520.1 unnamed protein product [Rangifer tarandus platyrhynchus]
MAQRLCLQHVSQEPGSWKPLCHKGLHGNRGAGLRPTIKGAEIREGLPKRWQVCVGCGRRKAVPTAQAHRQTSPYKFSDTSFENLNCGFQKDCKITVLNLKNKIFIFNLKVKLEGRLKAVIFQTEKENPHVTPSHNRSRSPALLSFSSTTSSPSSQGLPWAGRRRGSGHTGSSVPRLHGPLAPPSSQIQVALKEHGQAGDSDPKHNRGY